MGFANEILDAIEIMVRQVVEDNTTKIYTGVCKTTGANNCVLTINGKDNTVKYYGGVPVVGTVYQVFIPFGNMSAAFIIVPGSGGWSGVGNEGAELVYTAPNGKQTGLKANTSGYLDIYGLRKPTSLNFSEWDSGHFYERVDGDDTRYAYNVEFDAQGRPVKITDNDGHETGIYW